MSYYVIVNYQQALDLLVPAASEHDLQRVVAWLKKRKPKSAKAQQILRQLLRYPSFESELDWLTEWISDGNYLTIGEHIRETSSSTYFDWILALLIRYPDHPQNDRLWCSALTHFPDESVVAGAKRWLERDNVDNLAKGSVLAVLLVIEPSEELVAKGFELLSQPSICLDTALLTALLENTDDVRAIQTAVGHVQAAEHLYDLSLDVASALLQKNHDAYFPMIRDFFRKHWEHIFLPSALQMCCSLERNLRGVSNVHDVANGAPPPIALLALEWINEHGNSEKVLSLILHLELSGNDTLANLAWSWRMRNQSVDDCLRCLNSIPGSFNEWHIPPEVVSFARRWAQANTHNEKWPDAMKFLINVLPYDDMVAFVESMLTGDVPSQALLQVNLYLLIAKLKQNPSNINILMSEAWLLAHEQQKHSVHLAIELLNYKPGKLSKELLLKHDRGNASFIRSTAVLAALVKSGDKDAFADSKILLKLPKYTERFYHEHWERGELLKAACSSAPVDEDILNLAREWMRVRTLEPDLEFKSDYESACKRLVKHSHHPQNCDTAHRDAE